MAYFYACDKVSLFDTDPFWSDISNTGELPYILACLSGTLKARINTFWPANNLPGGLPITE